MMNKLSRRRVLAGATGALGVALAGCGMSSPDECQPATFPDGTETRDEPPEPCQYGAELEQKGLDVDSVFGGKGVSVMYYREPDNHAEQIRTIALTFLPYRRMVSEGAPLSFTTLSSNDDRHGVGYVPRKWADQRARGDISESEYLEKARGTYETR